MGRLVGSNGWLRASAALAVLCGVALLLLWRPVVRGDVFLPLDALLHLHPWRYSYERVPVNNPINTDPIKQIFPRRVLTNAIMEQGAWPLWNPSVLAGTPNLPDGQINLFYPPALLLILLPLAQAFGYYAFLHVCLAGIGAYVFARQIRLARGPAILAGVCYLLNGYLLTWLYFPHHTGATALLPWCFWAAGWAMARPGWWRWTLAGVVFALPVLSHLQIALYIYLGLAGYITFHLLQTRGWKPRLELAGGAAAAFVLALGLCAVQLLPGFAQAADGQRDDFSFAVGSADAQFSAVLRLVFPLIGASQRVGTPPAWGPAVLATPLPYVGIAPLILALVGLLFSRHRASVFFGLLALAAFALAVESPLLAVVQRVVPFYRQFTDQTRWFVLWEFAVALLAAMGAQALAAPPPGDNRTRLMLLFKRALVVAVGLFLALWGLWHLQLFTPQSRYGTYITLIRQQPLGVPAAVALLTVLVLACTRLRWVPPWLIWGALVLLAGGDLLWHGGSYNTSIDLASIRPTRDLSEALAAMPPAAGQSLFPPTRQTTFLQQQPGPFRILGADYEALPPNLAGAYGLEDVRGYQSLYAAQYNRLARLIDGKDYTHTGEGTISLRAYFTEAYNGRRLLDMLNVQYMIFTPGSTNPARYAPLELVQQNDEGSIYRNPRALPRAWIVHQVAVVPDQTAQLDWLARPDFDPATVAEIDAAAPAVAAAPAPEAVPQVAYGPNQAIVRAQLTAPGMLVLADAYSADWNVAVDGQPATLYRANAVLRGVWLPAGAHTVVFTYRPRAFLVGGTISLAFLALVVGAACWRISAVLRHKPAAGAGETSAG